MLILRVDFEPWSKSLVEDIQTTIAKEAAESLFRLSSVLNGNVNIVCSVYGHDMVTKPFPVSSGVIYAEWHAARATERATAYSCEHCGVSSLKEEWGPGRITCPRCGLMARSADGST